MTNGQFDEQYQEQQGVYQQYPGGGAGYAVPAPTPYPMLEMVSYITKTIGVLIIFVGVIGISGWVSDMSSYPFPNFDDLADSIFLIGIGGIISSISYLVLGVARMQRGIIEVRTWMYLQR